jgi:hypothetical protein
MRSAVWLVCMLALAPRMASAQPTSAQAETLFRQGKELIRAGKLAEACAAFDSSYKLDPAVSTLLNLADCREKNRQLATAWGLFVDAQRALRGKTDDASQQLLQTATKRAARLEPRLSTLAIEVAPDRRIARLELERRGERIDPGTWNRALPIDGGSYELVARAPGFAPWTTTIAIATEGEAKRIEVPALAPLAAAAPAPAGAPPARRAARRGDGKLVASLALTTGGAAIATSLVLGKLALDKWHAAEDTCDGMRLCADDALTARANHLADQARTRAWWSTGLAAGGVAIAGVGLYLALRRSPRREVAIAPYAAPGAFGVAITGGL